MASCSSIHGFEKDRKVVTANKDNNACRRSSSCVVSSCRPYPTRTTRLSETNAPLLASLPGCHLIGRGICHLILVKTGQVWDVDPAILSAVASPQVPADSPLRGFHVGVVAGVEDHQLDVAEDRLNGIVVWAACGQRDPMPFQATHLTPRPD